MPEDRHSATTTEAPGRDNTEPQRSTRHRGRPDHLPDHRLDHLPPYRVLLHNDDHTHMLDVVDALLELTPHPRQRSVEIMLTAHTRGVALVLVTHKERAELYRDQFRARGLTVTLEPDRA